jgi:hypothetical protein
LLDVFAAVGVMLVVVAAVGDEVEEMQTGVE